MAWQLARLFLQQPGNKFPVVTGNVSGLIPAFSNQVTSPENYDYWTQTTFTWQIVDIDSAGAPKTEFLECKRPYKSRYRFLTLGAHGQRGLVYLVCVCVCMCVCVCCLHLFSPYRDQAGSSAIPTALAQQGLEKLCGDFA